MNGLQKKKLQCIETTNDDKDACKKVHRNLWQVIGLLKGVEVRADTQSSNGSINWAHWNVSVQISNQIKHHPSQAERLFQLMRRLD